MIITYDNADIAVKAYYMLRDSMFEDKNLIVLLLPNIMPDLIQKGVRVSHSNHSFSVPLCAYYCAFSSLKISPLLAIARIRQREEWWLSRSRADIIIPKAAQPLSSVRLG